MAQKPWTSAEKKRLALFVGQSLTNEMIAKKLNRSIYSVIGQIKVMNLKRPVVDDPVDFTVRIPGALYDQLEIEAKTRGMSKGHFYRTLLERELTEKRECTNI